MRSDKDTPSSGVSRGLTRKASLTFFSQLILTAARSVSALILTPVLLRTVGAESFGLWSMLQQLVSYVSIADLRPSGALKYLLGNKQAQHHTDEERNRIISVAIRYSIVSIPVFVGLGLLVLSQLDRIIPGEGVRAEEAALVFAVLFCGFLIDRIVSIPNGILTAQNFAYAGTVNATIWVLLGVVGSIFVLNAGFGLVGIATVTTLAMVGRGVSQLAICVRTLPWISLTRPRREDYRVFASISGWLSLSSIAQFGLASIDVLVVGALLGAKTAGIYAATALVPKAVFQVIGSSVSSGNAGLLALLSSRDLPRVAVTRNELVALGLLAIGAVAPIVVVGNGALVSAWLGADHVAWGATTTMILCLLSVQALARVDSVLLDGFSEIKQKALWQAGSAIVGVLGAYIGSQYGLAEAVLGFVAGNTIFGVFLQRRVLRLIERDTETISIAPFGLGLLLIIAAISVAFCTQIPAYASLSRILEGLLLSTCLSLGCCAAIWFLAIPCPIRLKSKERIKVGFTSVVTKARRCL